MRQAARPEGERQPNVAKGVKAASPYCSVKLRARPSTLRGVGCSLCRLTCVCAWLRLTGSASRSRRAVRQGASAYRPNAPVR